MVGVLRIGGDRILMVDLAYNFLASWKSCYKTLFVPARESDLIRDAALFHYASGSNFLNIPESDSEENFILPLVLRDGRVLRKGLKAKRAAEFANWVIDETFIVCRHEVVRADFENSQAYFTYVPSELERLRKGRSVDLSQIEQMARSAEEEMQERLLAWGGDEDWNRCRDNRAVPQNHSEYWASLGFPPGGPPLS